MKVLALLTLGVFTLSTHAIAKKDIPDYEDTDSVQVCTIPLPVTGSSGLNKLMFGTKHMYLKVNGKTYGTPFTADGGYWGGDAYLYTEDIFHSEEKLAKSEKCYSVKKKITDDDEVFAKRMECIADKLSIKSQSNNRIPIDLYSQDIPKSEPEVPKAWYPVFDYHFLKNNCGSMVDYLVSCNGGIDVKTSNLGVGNKVPLTKAAKIIDNSGTVEVSTYGDICEKAKVECE